MQGMPHVLVPTQVKNSTRATVNCRNRRRPAPVSIGCPFLRTRCDAGLGGLPGQSVGSVEFSSAATRALIQPPSTNLWLQQPDDLVRLEPVVGPSSLLCSLVVTTPPGTSRSARAYHSSVARETESTRTSSPGWRDSNARCRVEPHTGYCSIAHGQPRRRMGWYTSHGMGRST
jgi:hypothetical protein